jgi:hypothetical protein
MSEASYKLVRERVEGVLDHLPPEDREAIEAWVEDTAAERIRKRENVETGWSVFGAVAGFTTPAAIILVLFAYACGDISDDAIAADRDQALSARNSAVEARDAALARAQAAEARAAAVEQRCLAKLTADSAPALDVPAPALDTPAHTP